MAVMDEKAEQLTVINKSLATARKKEQKLKAELSVLRGEIAVHERDRVLALKALRVGLSSQSSTGHV